MVIFRKCCCLSLRQASLTICQFTLLQEIFSLFFLIFTLNQKQPTIITPRSESRSSFYFQFWVKIFNIFVIGIGLYGILKEKVHLIIPFLAFKTVNLVFIVVELLNLRSIVDNFNAQYEQMSDSNDKTDFLPLIFIIFLVMIGLDLYILLIVYSYYKSLLQNRNLVAIDAPIVIYSPHSHNDGVIYSQPAENPFLFQPKSPYHFNVYAQPPPSYANSAAMNVNQTFTEPLPPPYRA